MHVFGACLNLSFKSINQSSLTSCGGVDPSGNAASCMTKHTSLSKGQPIKRQKKKNLQ